MGSEIAISPPLIGVAQPEPLARRQDRPIQPATCLSSTSSPLRPAASSITTLRVILVHLSFPCRRSSKSSSSFGTDSVPPSQLRVPSPRVGYSPRLSQYANHLHSSSTLATIHDPVDLKFRFNLKGSPYIDDKSQTRKTQTRPHGLQTGHEICIF